MLPVVLLVSFATRRSVIDRRTTPLVPLFGVVFFVLVIVNSLGWVPLAAAQLAGELSRWCLVAAIAAIGMKTSLKDLSVVGMRPVVLMVLQTVALAGLVAALILVK